MGAVLSSLREPRLPKLSPVLCADRRRLRVSEGVWHQFRSCGNRGCPKKVGLYYVFELLLERREPEAKAIAVEYSIKNGDHIEKKMRDFYAALLLGLLTDVLRGRATPLAKSADFVRHDPSAI